jgi:hypothetical protein
VDRRPWQEWLTPGQFAELCPRGQADLDAFYDRVEEQERHGIPAACKDFETYCDVARVAAS